jgi:hypothetical protein
MIALRRIYDPVICSSNVLEKLISRTRINRAHFKTWNVSWKTKTPKDFICTLRITHQNAVSLNYIFRRRYLYTAVYISELLIHIKQKTQHCQYCIRQLYIVTLLLTYDPLRRNGSINKQAIARQRPATLEEMLEAVFLIPFVPRLYSDSHRSNFSNSLYVRLCIRSMQETGRSHPESPKSKCTFNWTRRSHA